MSKETNERPILTDEQRARALGQFANGLAAAIPQFFRARRVNFKPSKEGAEPILLFTSLLMAEWGPSPKDYPFKSSIKTVVGEAFTQAAPALAALVEISDYANFDRLCRVVGSKETLLFLDNNAPDAIKLMEKIVKGEND